MLTKLKLTDNLIADEFQLSKSPIIVGILCVFLATLYYQNSFNLASGKTLIFTMIMVAHLLLYLFCNILFKNKHWLYFGIQGVIVFNCAIMMPTGYQVIFLGLIPLLVCQSIAIYHNTIKAIITFFFFYAIFCYTAIKLNGVPELIHSIPTLLLITICIYSYYIIFFKQIKLRVHAQKILQELELAYEKVEDLTLTNERQRMARDLHDTLSQGLAGIIMQLEAVNANLNKNNTNRAQEIVKNSMEHARKTLSDSRLVIDNLRHQANKPIDLAKALENEIYNFKNISATFIRAGIKIESQIPLKISKHLIYIVREALNNIAKHSEAESAVIEIIEINHELNINIKDDGIGFDVKLINQLFGHYGLLGMTERVKAINGKLKIKSKRKSGTYINVIIPIEKGIDEENE